MLVRYEAVRGSKPSEAVQKRARWAQEKVDGRSRLAKRQDAPETGLSKSKRQRDKCGGEAGSDDVNLAALL